MHWRPATSMPAARARAIAGTDYPRTSAERRALWAQVGVISDSVSTTVLGPAVQLRVVDGCGSMPVLLSRGRGGYVSEDEAHTGVHLLWTHVYRRHVDG